MRSESEKRCSRCGVTKPFDAFAVRRASFDGRQGYCRECHAAWARARRPRKLKDAPPVGAGEKWCRRCETIQPTSSFASNKAAADGLQAYCRACGADIYRRRREADGHVVRPAGVPEGFKFCRTCETVKPLTEWSLNERASDGLQTRCKACASAAGRRDHLMKSYGLDDEAVAQLRLTQAGLCAICLARPAIHVDHDHATGAVRGMLCFCCNAALGQLDDDVGRLHRAADYLQGRRLVITSPHPGVFLMGRTDPSPLRAPGQALPHEGDVVDFESLLAKARGA